jgi:hypothetical protein
MGEAECNFGRRSDCSFASYTNCLYHALFGEVCAGLFSSLVLTSVSQASTSILSHILISLQSPASHQEVQCDEHHSCRFGLEFNVLDVSAPHHSIDVIIFALLLAPSFLHNSIYECSQASAMNISGCVHVGGNWYGQLATNTSVG